jgi:hypothetical protein
MWVSDDVQARDAAHQVLQIGNTGKKMKRKISVRRSIAIGSRYAVSCRVAPPHGWGRLQLHEHVLV